MEVGRPWIGPAKASERLLFFVGLRVLVIHDAELHIAARALKEPNPLVSWRSMSWSAGAW